MPKANANNIQIEYDTFGDPSSKTLLLIKSKKSILKEFLTGKARIINIQFYFLM